MYLLTDEVIRFICLRYILDNTPLQFFKHLRAAQIIQAQVSKLDTPIVIKRIDEILISMDNYEQLIEIYGLLVILSFKCDVTVSSALRKYSSIGNDWIGRIARLSSGIRTPIYSGSVSGISRFFCPYRTDSSATSAESQFDDVSHASINEEGK
jgi:hypothetical protein